MAATRCTDRPENADVILFNTCSVREKAQERVFHDLGRVRALKARAARTSSSASAAASRARKAPQSSGAPRTSTSCSARRRCTGCPRSSARGARPARRRSTSRFPAIEKFDHLPPPRVEGASAFLSIMEGCSKYCTFCVVPYTRGEEVSRPFDDVLTEVADLADQGVMEVTLLGQNVNAYRAPMGTDGGDRRPRDAARIHRRGSRHRAHPLHDVAPEGDDAAAHRRARHASASSSRTCTCRCNRAPTACWRR